MRTHDGGTASGFADGTALSVTLPGTGGTDAVQALLQLGFSSALAFDAGLACDAAGNLTLTRWMPGAVDAPGLEAASGALRDQRAAWQVWLGPGATPPASLVARQDQRRQRDLLALLSRTADRQP